MGDYCNESDLETASGGPDAFVQLFDFDADGAADAQVITKAITRAERVVNSYVAKQYTVPVTEPASAVDELRDIAAELAVYFTKGWRGGHTISQQEIDHHTETIKWLEGVSKGEIQLASDPVPAKHSSRRDGVIERGDGFDVSRKKLRGILW